MHRVPQRADIEGLERQGGDADGDQDRRWGAAVKPGQRPGEDHIARRPEEAAVSAQESEPVGRLALRERQGVDLMQAEIGPGADRHQRQGGQRQDERQEFRRAFAGRRRGVDRGRPATERDQGYERGQEHQQDARAQVVVSLELLTPGRIDRAGEPGLVERLAEQGRSLRQERPHQVHRIDAEAGRPAGISPAIAISQQHRGQDD